MQAREFFRAVANDRFNLIERLLRLIEPNGIRYCVIGGMAVSAYAEPNVGLDFDVVVADYQLGRFESLLASTFMVRRTLHVIEITAAGSDIRVNVFTDTRFADFIERAELKNLLGMTLPVAYIQDVLRGKVWLYQDETRSASKRLSDLSDIARLLERHPKMRSQVPPNILLRIGMPGA